MFLFTILIYSSSDLAYLESFLCNKKTRQNTKIGKYATKITQKIIKIMAPLNYFYQDNIIFQ